MKTRNTSWGKVAGWYDKLLERSPDTYQAKVILPNLLRIVGPYPGQTIIDIACGQGFFSRALAARGATVVGADNSTELIAIAKKHSPPSIVYHVAPAHQMLFAKKRSFDVALIVLAVQNIENYASVIAECARVLKPDGRLIIVMNHTAFRIPGASAWGYDDGTKTQYRRVDSYLSESQTKIAMHPGNAPKEFTVSFHRPLQNYMKALAKSGLAITRFEEWISHKHSGPGPRAKAEDAARKEIPLFLCIEARRIG